MATLFYFTFNLNNVKYLTIDKLIGENSCKIFTMLLYLLYNIKTKNNGKSN